MNYLVFLLFFISFSVFSQNLEKQKNFDETQTEEKRKETGKKKKFIRDKPEVGFWLGASNPFPGTQTFDLLETTLGFGIFSRFQLPYQNFYTEIGMSYANYLSTSERALTTIPIYAALDYKLPFESLPVSLFLKGGLGMSYVLARPANTNKWDPLLFSGFEVSFIAGKKVRIGLRIDYNHIFETMNSKLPPETQLLYQGVYDDYRLYNPNYYKLMDAQFFHFALMLSFLF